MDPTTEPRVTPEATPAEPVVAPAEPTNDAPTAAEPVSEPVAPGALASEPVNEPAAPSASGPPTQGAPSHATGVTDEPSVPPASLSPEELAQIREIVIQANPEAVHELIQGGTLAELTASVEGAKSAYQRIAEGIRAKPVSVPAGQPGRQPEVLPENATPDQRIAAGLRARSHGLVSQVG